MDSSLLESSSLLLSSEKDSLEESDDDDAISLGDGCKLMVHVSSPKQ
jgi:hypothetical protein